MKVSSFGIVLVCVASLSFLGTSRLFANVIEYAYDPAGRLAQLDNVDEVHRAYYTHDSAGNLISISTVEAPVITSGPVDLEVSVGETANFSVEAGGGGLLTFQWSKNGLFLANAKLAELILANAQNPDAGSYSVFVSNELGSIESNSANLTVTGEGTNPMLVAPFEEAPYLGNRTYDTWMGLAYLPDGEVTELYLREQGWISMGPALSGGMWYWDYAMVEWVYTNPVFYPNIYVPSLEWLLYWDPFSNAETRWFYRYTDNDYYSWPRYPGPLPY